MWNWLWMLIRRLFGLKDDNDQPKPELVYDEDKAREGATPRPDIAVVSPEIKKTVDTYRWYMTPAMIMLLEAIRKHEAPAGYNQRFRERIPQYNLSNMTFDQVRALGRARVTKDGMPSSAIGGYQFITITLDSLKTSVKLSGTEMFTPTLQDDLAVALMIRRGWMDFMRDRISATQFANNLAKEWASLPVVSPIIGNKKFMLKPGQSYYTGDKLNKAFHKPEAIMALVRQLRVTRPPNFPL